MRNYPSVPNVFRVASTHSVNNEGTYATAGQAAGQKTTATTALSHASAKLNTETPAETPTSANIAYGLANIAQQQQQHQRLTPQSLANAGKTIVVGTPIRTVVAASSATMATSMFSGAASPTDSSTLGSSLENEQFKQKQYQQIYRQQQQQQQQHQQQQRMQQKFHVGGQSVNASGGGAGAAVGNCNGNDAIMNKLTKTRPVEYSSASGSGNRASLGGETIEAGVAYQNGRAQFQQPQQLHSAYASLPRTVSGISNGDLRHNKSNNGGRSVAGVINTISGSIPATGFTLNGHAGTSIGSDLNLAMNNSCSDLGKLNGDASQHGRQHQHQQQQQRLQQQQYEDYRFTRICKDSEGHDFSLKRNAATSVAQAGICSRRSSSFNNNSSGYLWILTPVAASISVAIVIAALAGPQWLFTEEKLPNSVYNGTGNFNTLDDGAYVTKFTKSSLWILCTTMQGIETYNCIKIDYFSKEGYQPDPHDSTSAIPYTVTKSCPFFLASGVALLISFIVFLIPTCSHQNSLYYFSAGIMFIVSGLLMLIGLIAYISILKAEIGSKLRPRSTLQPALFKVNYGQSFFLFVFGFIATEFVGLLNIFLYISLQEVSYYSRLPCFTLSNVREKIIEGKNPRSQTYKSYKHTTASTTTNHEANKPMQRRRANVGQQHHQVHNVRSPLPQHLAAGETLPKTCRRHPNAKEPQNFDLERRYYFDDATPSMIMKCNLHTRNMAKSLNELYTEPATLAAAAPPPPSAIRARVAQTLPRQLQLQASPSIARFGDLPQEFPLTRSVSTTTEIFQNNNEYGILDGDRRSAAATPHFERRSRRNMATNTQTMQPTDTVTMRIGGSDMRQMAAKRGCQQTNESRHTSEMQRNGHNRDDVDGDEANSKNINNADNNEDDDENGELFDDEGPQRRLCGLKRGIRKTKDELFQEFCKRAGMRPKPKNIYYIANEEEMLRRKRHNGELVGGLGTLIDDDLEYAEDEDGFKQLNARNERAYGGMEARNMRRASMFVEPAHLRKLNSNLSLHMLYPTENRVSGQKSGFYETIRTEVPNENWPLYPEPLRGAYGGSQSRLDANSQLHQNRATLPRSFLRSNNDSQDSIASISLQALHNPYSGSQTRLSNFVLHQPQQQPQSQHQFLQPHDRLLSNSRGTVGYLHKSYDDLNASNYATDSAQLPINGNANQQPVIQWPAAIPSSPANFGRNYAIYGTTTAARAPPQHTASQHALIARSASGGGGSGAVGANGQPKFQRAFAFDEQRRASAVVDPFDLDEIERERRRSHASLFNGGGLTLGVHTFSPSNSTQSPTEHYDLVNGNL